MGRSTVEQLINKAKSLNEYNNSGVSSDVVWCEHFNSALFEMVDDLDIEEITTIQVIPGTREYPLPDDYYAIRLLFDAVRNENIVERRNYDQIYPYGYWVLNKGNSYVIDLFNYTEPRTFTMLYHRYPAVLTVSEMKTQKPEVPTAGELALVYKAIKFALLNNNQLGQATYYEDLYTKEVARMRVALLNARGT